MNTFRIIVIIITIVLGSNAFGSNGLTPDRIMLPLASKHYGMEGYRENGRTRSFNEFNPGLLLAWENRALGLDVTAGAYRNSHHKTSGIAYVSRTWEVADTDIHIGPFIGVSHYGRNSKFIDSRVTYKGFVFMGGLYARWKYVFVNVVPNPVQDNLKPIVGVGLTFPTQ